MKEYTLKTLDDTEEIWYYDSKRGIFMPNAEPIIKARIEADKGMPHIDKDGKIKESSLTTYDVNEYLNHIRRRTPVSREDFNRSIEWIACTNCMLNVKTGETKPFSPDFMNTTHIPVNYIQYNSEHIHSLSDFRRPTGTGFVADFFRLVECPCPLIMKFLYEVMSPEDVEFALDFMAYCLWREYKFNLWMLFHGAGYNGKSVLLMLIERFFGAHNVSGETLDRLVNQPQFTTASLFHKMVNVDADVSADVIFKNTGIIKKLTGNDLHPGEYKFKTPFAFRNYAKLIFSCNKIPETEDDTDAFFRRIIIINFTQQFFGEKDDPDLIDKLCTEEEFSGLLYELLSRLPRVLKDGIKKVTNEALAETYDKYTRGSNPVKYFQEKALMWPLPGDKVPKRDMYQRYFEFCAEFGLAPESDQSFSRKLTQSGLKTQRGRINGELAYCWMDVRLRDWQKEEREAQQSLDFTDETKDAMK